MFADATQISSEICLPLGPSVARLGSEQLSWHEVGSCFRGFLWHPVSGLCPCACAFSCHWQVLSHLQSRVVGQVFSCLSPSPTELPLSPIPHECWNPRKDLPAGVSQGPGVPSATSDLACRPCALGRQRRELRGKRTPPPPPPSTPFMNHRHYPRNLRRPSWAPGGRAAGL